MKTYILQKDLPDSRSGDEYISNTSTECYHKEGNVLGSFWSKEYVENNPEWFLEKNEETCKGEWQLLFCIISLKRGDIVRFKGKSTTYVVNANYGERATATAIADITNSSEWEVLKTT